jgi:CheY-specific phosphatase CheX
LSEKWKRRWVKILLGGSVILPVFVLLELKLGLLAGGIADLGGLMVIIGLIGMLVGILRYTGHLDTAEGAK